MPTRPPVHRPTPPAARPRDGRPSAHRRGYTARWRAYRLAFLAANPLCVRCGYGASQVDHVTPVTGADDPGFWDEQNHQSLCESCHSKKTAIEDRGRGR